jgi:hypothetical protein
MYGEFDSFSVLNAAERKSLSVMMDAGNFDVIGCE